MGGTDELKVDDIVASLRALGVRAGDALMPHVAMRDLVPVEGGPRGVLAALRKAVGAQGTLLVHLPCEAGEDVVRGDDRTKAHNQLVRRAGFDPYTARPRAILGDFAAAALTAEDAALVAHPVGRFAAFGRHAEKLTAKISWDDPLGPGSPVDLLGSLKGKVLDFGVDAAQIASVHLAEYYAKPAGRARASLFFKLTDARDPYMREVRMIDDQLPDPRHERALDAARTQRFARAGAIGRARVTLFEAGPLVRFLARRLAGPDLFRTVLRIHETVADRR